MISQHKIARRACRFRKLLTRLARARSGATAVEFGLIALFSIELVTEGMQAGLYFYASAAVERAAWSSSRQLLTGSVVNQSLTASQFRSNVVCPPIAAAHLSCANVITNLQTVTEGTYPNGFYSLVNLPQTALIRPALDNTQTTYCIGGSGSYVVMQLLYALPVFSPLWRLFATSFNSSPAYIIQATAAFRNEPFQGAAPC